MKSQSASSASWPPPADSVSRRLAHARGTLRMAPATLMLIQLGNLGKGDVLGVARLAAIQGAKRTADLIPLCHPVLLTHLVVEFTLDAENTAVHCDAVAHTSDTTDVEMEALAAVGIALLTIYDMCKAVDRGMRIADISLVEKAGGKSGEPQAEGYSLRLK